MTANHSKEDLNPHWIFAISVLCTGFFCILGFIGNIISIIALGKDRRKNSYVYLLMALAVADWCFLLFIFNGVVTVQFCKYFNYHTYLDHLKNAGQALPTIWAIGCIIQTGTIWFVVAVTWDRFYAIGWPFKRKRKNSNYRACKLICGVIVFAVIFNIPKFFHYYPIDRNPAHSDRPYLAPNSTDLWLSAENCTANSLDEDCQTITPSEGSNTVNMTKLFENKWYHYVYYTSLSWLLLYIIPLCTLIILNILLFRQIRRAQKSHANLIRSPRQRESLSVTVNIVAIVTIFILCQTPDFIHTLISYPSFEAHANLKDYMKSAAYAFLAFNSSINFIIYCLFYKRFRNTVLHMFCYKHNCNSSIQLNRQYGSSKSAYNPDLTNLL